MNKSRNYTHFWINSFGSVHSKFWLETWRLTWREHGIYHETEIYRVVISSVLLHISFAECMIWYQIVCWKCKKIGLSLHISDRWIVVTFFLQWQKGFKLIEYISPFTRTATPHISRMAFIVRWRISISICMLPGLFFIRIHSVSVSQWISASILLTPRTGMVAIRIFYAVIYLGVVIWVRRLKKTYTSIVIKLSLSLFCWWNYNSLPIDMDKTIDNVVIMMMKMMMMTGNSGNID